MLKLIQSTILIVFRIKSEEEESRRREKAQQNRDAHFRRREAKLCAQIRELSLCVQATRAKVKDKEEIIKRIR